MRDRLVHRGPDSDGVYVSTAGSGRPRVPAAEDHRPDAERQPADGERGRHRAGRLQRRDLQLPGRCARGWSRAATGSARRATPRSSCTCTRRRAPTASPISRACSRSRSGTSAARLTLARDRAGKKPLFYYRDDRLLAFASEMKAFFEHPDISIEPDPEAVPYYFIYGYVPLPATIYKRVSQLEPGTLMTVDAGRPHRDAPLLAAALSRGGDVRPIARAEAAAGVPRAADARGRAAADERRAARRVSQRRPRLDDRRRPDEPADVGAGQDVQHRVRRRSGVRRDRVRAAGRRAVQDRSHRVPRVAVGDRPDRHAGLASRRPVRRLVGRCRPISCRS